MTNDERRPRCVQRIEARDSAWPSSKDKKGVDAHFIFAYMGSSEFEWGALPRALKEMKAVIAGYVVKKLVHGAHVGWVVCHEDTFPQTLAFFVDQFEDRKWSLQERSCISGAYIGDKYDGKFIGWWAIDAVPPWVIFKKKEDARTWLKALSTVKGKEA